MREERRRQKKNKKRMREGRCLKMWEEKETYGQLMIGFYTTRVKVIFVFST